MSRLLRIERLRILSRNDRICSFSEHVADLSTEAAPPLRNPVMGAAFYSQLKCGRPLVAFHTGGFFASSAFSSVRSRTSAAFVCVRENPTDSPRTHPLGAHGHTTGVRSPARRPFFGVLLLPLSLRRSLAARAQLKIPGSLSLRVPSARNSRWRENHATDARRFRAPTFARRQHPRPT